MSQSTERVSEPAGTAGPALAAAARPGLADPGAWAVTAFATTSFMLGMYNANLINAAGAGDVISATFGRPVLPVGSLRRQPRPVP